MYSVLNSRKVTFENKYESTLHTCCFLDNQYVLLLFQDGNFSVIDSQSSENDKETYHSRLEPIETITNCKRVSFRTCVVTTNQKQNVYLLRLINPSLVLIQQIIAKQLAFLNACQTSTKIYSFNSNSFVIMEEVFQDKVVYFLAITFNEQHKYSMKLISHELQWINSNFDIVKGLQKSNQMAIYKQKEIAQVGWKINLISICHQSEDKHIDLHSFLTEEHSIVDLMAKDDNQYLLFASKCTSSDERLQVWSTRLHNNKGRYYQSCDLMVNYAFNSVHFVEIIFVNHDLGFFLVKQHAHQQVNNQIFYNTLEIVNLETGITFEKIYCNLKQLDVCPNKSLTLDYAPDINIHEQFVFHIRSLLNKKIVYYFLMRNSPVFSKEDLSRSFLAEVLLML